ncbi:IclR family transcriptional regulator [Sulfobacillus thermosulfidooxidans]|uniref:IclR family transcriptional regulator n=1 Tax=Sulfobacillus thermosulfidooxidans TaxID=28034 RepID=UPI0006B4985D|nr:IclR family transcriptional regulator [Sulfobacillus thermosulfidooxidans]
MSTTQQSSVHVILRVSALLDVLAQQSPASLAYLTEVTGLPKTTVHRLLQTLEHESIVMRSQQGYAIGPRIAKWHSPFDPYRWLKLLGPPILREMADKSRETASIFVGLRDRRVCWVVVDGPQEVRHVPMPDQVFPLGVGSAGKLLLSAMPPAEREQAIAATRARFPQVAIAPVSEDELNAIYQLGYAVSIEEREPGLASVAALVPGLPRVCMSLSGPVHRFGPLALGEFIKIAQDAAQQIEQALSLAVQGGNALWTPDH